MKRRRYKGPALSSSSTAVFLRGYQNVRKDTGARNGRQPACAAHISFEGWPGGVKMDARQLHPHMHVGSGHRRMREFLELDYSRTSLGR